MRRLRDRAWPPSRIGLRLLAFNLLVMFVPVVGVLYLDVYEDRLLQAQEREMVQQGRLLAAAAVADGELRVDEINRILVRLERQSEARFRVYDAAGSVVADSARIPILPSASAPDGYAGSFDPDVRGRILYRLGVWLVGVRQRIGSIGRTLLRPGDLEPSGPQVNDGLAPEVRAALAGRYGAATRHTPGQRSMTLFSAVPVRAGDSVMGAIVVSQSTFRMLQAIYDVRLRIFQVVIASVFAAAMLTTIAAMTIVRPLRRLRRQAASLTERSGPLPASFPGAARKDELGDLARALEELTRRVNEQIALLEGFAADVAHEFKNPLASIRTAAEMAAQAEHAEDRERFLALMLRDVDRLERLVSGARDMARIDGELEQQDREIVLVVDMVNEAIERIGARCTTPIELAAVSQRVLVRASRERLGQVLDNVLSNAASFATPGTCVEVAIEADDRVCSVSIADRGPGIPDAHRDRIFERFFTYRPSFDRRDHVGLGLAIARRIVESHGGSITARNRDGGGAVFEVRLPLARAWSHV